jgi:2-polyprenyl-3-methyl-5-hydroxy-6-metoxy-1,4-benzoquinol methylase
MIENIKENIKQYLNLYNYEEMVKIKEIKVIVDTINKYSLNNSKMNHLDLGGGNGLYAYRLKINKLYSNITVVDNYVDGIYGFNHIKKPIENIKLGNKYNTMSCMLVLELVPNRIEILKTIKNSLENNGICFISFPNIDGINVKLWKQNALENKTELSKIFLKNHTLFTISEFEDDLDSVDMEIVNIQGTSFLPSYTTNPKIRFNRNIYDDIDEKLIDMIEPSYFLAVVKHKNDEE